MVVVVVGLTHEVANGSGEGACLTDGGRCCIYWVCIGYIFRLIRIDAILLVDMALFTDQISTALPLYL